MRERLETAALAVLALVLAAFAVSAVVGFVGRERAAAPVAGDARSAARRLDEIGPRVRVEVLNGSGRAGLARRAMSELRDRGFDVVYIGNAERPEGGRTAVIDRAGRPDDAKAVARALGAGRVSSAPDPSLYLEVTVVLGDDWPPTPEKGAEEGGRGGE